MNNPETRFAVEVTVTVQERSYYSGQETEVLSQTNRIVPLDYANIPEASKEHYLRSQWTAMLSGEEEPFAAGENTRVSAVPASEPRVVEDRPGDEAEPDDEADPDEWTDF